MFGGKKLSQSQHDELEYEKAESEASMAKQFDTPKDYQMRNKPVVGKEYETPEGDVVKVLKLNNDGSLKVRYAYGPESIEFNQKNGLNSKPFTINWSGKQFDTILSK